MTTLSKAFDEERIARAAFMLKALDDLSRKESDYYKGMQTLLSAARLIDEEVYILFALVGVQALAARRPAPVAGVVDVVGEGVLKLLDANE